MALTPPNITRNLAPGSQGPDVQALQQWLQAQGYFPANQSVTTNYGPITEQAVAAWQKANNIDTQGNPGYFGPISRTFVSNNSTTTSLSGAANLIASYDPGKPAGTATAPSGTTNTTAGTGSSNGSGTGTSATGTGATGTSSSTSSTETKTTPADISSSVAALGITQAQFNMMSPQQQALLGILGSVVSTQYSSGIGTSLNDALAAAQSNPTIIAKYADALALDKEQLQQSITSAQTQLSSTATQQAQTFESDRKTLAAAQSAAGLGQSGFRKEAQSQLEDSENSVVQSTQAAQQKVVDDLTSAFEAKYGTASTTPAAISYSNPNNASNIGLNGQIATGGPQNQTITGHLAGGVTGTQAPAEQNDILNLAASLEPSFENTQTTK